MDAYVQRLTRAGAHRCINRLACYGEQETNVTDTMKRRKTPKPPIVTELNLRDWGPRGSTRAGHGQTAVLVDRGIPGEQVVASIDTRRRPRRGVVVDVIEASSDRVAPPCPFYLAGCGGCQWQHLDYGTQVAVKRLGVDREMERAGVTARVSGTHPMADAWRYRHTAAIALGWEAGFRPRGRRGIVQIDDCLISHPAVGALAASANGMLHDGTIPNYHGKVWLDCTVVGCAERPRVQVLIQGISGLTLETHPELEAVARSIAAIDGVESVAYRHKSGEARPLVGDLMATIEVQGRPMWLPAGSFFQTNLKMLSMLLDRVRGELTARRVDHLADIYGGVGTFGLQLADCAGEVTLVELDHQAVLAARRTAEDWGLRNVSFVDRHAERVLPELPTVDAVIVDPPRSGLGPGVTQAIADNGVPLVLYVSCSPPSLADDLAILSQRGFNIRSVEIFDFYPQTYHVESLAVLER